MELLVKRKISIDKKNCTRVGEFWYNPIEDSIAFELSFPVPLKLKITKLWKVEATPMFMWLPTIMRGHINIDLLCLLLDSIRLVQQGKVLIHGSCYEPEYMNGSSRAEGILNVGFQNTGKTYNTYMAIKRGAFLISEEHTVIDEKQKACPYKEYVRSCMSWRTLRDCEIYITPREGLKLLLRTIRAKIFPFMFEAVIYKTRKVSRIISEVAEVRVGGKKIEENLYTKLVYLTDNEYSFMSCDILVAYAYASGFDLRFIQIMRRTLLLKFVENVESKTA